MGCSASGGGSYGSSFAAGGASTGSGAAAGGSYPSDGSADEEGGAGGAGATDAATDADANVNDASAIDGRADVSLDADTGPDVTSDAARPDVSVDGGGDASLDARSDANVVEARSEAADVATDRMPSDAPVSSRKSCVERCNADPDCEPTLPIADFECDLATHKCVVCRNDLACVAAASGWIVSCGQTSDCQFVGDVCIDVNGVGKCAFKKETCAGSFPDDIQAREMATGATVTVCGVATSECHDGRCVDRCGSLHSCTPEQGGRVCNEATGKCECTGDNDCSGGVGVSKCNTITKQCECAGNTDCAGIDDFEICVDGKCGCSSVTVCKRDFTGTTLTCE
jgi:hypothetical protein